MECISETVLPMNQWFKIQKKQFVSITGILLDLSSWQSGLIGEEYNVCEMGENKS